MAPSTRWSPTAARRRRWELTDGGGAQVVLDFVGEGTVADGVAMLGAGGSYFVVGYGDTLSVPTMQMVLTETASSAWLAPTSTWWS